MPAWVLIALFLLILGDKHITLTQHSCQPSRIQLDSPIFRQCEDNAETIVYCIENNRTTIGYCIENNRTTIGYCIENNRTTIGYCIENNRTTIGYCIENNRTTIGYCIENNRTTICYCIENNVKMSRILVLITWQLCIGGIHLVRTQ